ncbi:MAG: NHL repeat-containing protein [Gemmatimonadetes bacterium]|nr:NHL repeat-containing protein [Gemmatimonadota bacterium]
MRRFIVGLAIAVAAFLGVYGGAYLYYHAGSLRENCRRIAAWGGGGDAGLNHPMQLAWGEGLLHVADTEDGAVKQYRPDGSLVARWTGFDRPVALAVAKRAVYVADFLADQVVKLSPEGEVLDRWGQHGTGLGQFDAPAGVAVDQQGNVYASDFYNHRIQKFDAAGRVLAEWGDKGRTRGRFRYPTGIAVSDRGEVFVADAFNHRVQVFTPEGEYLREWGGIGFGIGGSWPGWFFLAKEIALDPRGDVWVVDAFNRRLQKFTPEGDLLAIWNPDDPDFAYPSGVAVGPEGSVFISEFYTSRIHALQCR